MTSKIVASALDHFDGDLLVCPGIPIWSKHFLEREFFSGNTLVRIHIIIVMIRWTGLAP